MTSETITSLQNPRVKHLVKLRDRRHRDSSGRFLIEGYRELSRALARKVAVEEVFFSPDWFSSENDPALLLEIARSRGAGLFQLSKVAFEKCSYRDKPDGFLAVAKQWRHSLDELSLPPDPLLLVCERIEKPGNLGALLRCADAAGAHAVIVCDAVTDIFNPNVVRASTGVLFSVPVVVSRREEFADFVRVRGIKIVATTPRADLLYTAADMKGPLAVLIGGEHFGLGEEWLAHADLKVRIPMAGQADSLNAGMAAIIVLFEAVRQRSLL